MWARQARGEIRRRLTTTDRQGKSEGREKWGGGIMSTLEVDIISFISLQFLLLGEKVNKVPHPTMKSNNDHEPHFIRVTFSLDPSS